MASGDDLIDEFGVDDIEAKVISEFAEGRGAVVYVPKLVPSIPERQVNLVL